ncbi:efflux transporter outer membrane subunit [Flavisphingomonas formosensis]|uniref:efflux transporter outer membrane subunit n=1 Tax=Flavisphingomonas formosensis TaxID=861534 RepID=UPI0012FBEEC6|nr:efflux transporter outer membrane subunit [Sphingomonas formosensis]
MKRAAIPLLALATSACALGPKSPTTAISLPPPANAATIPSAAGPAQQVVPGAAVRADWWRLFDAPLLDALVDRALAANNDLATAEANLRQARQQAAATAGASLPQIDAGYQAQRIRTSRTLSNPLPDPDQYLYTLHSAQLSVAYPLDLFGAQRSKLLSARAAAEVAQHRLTAAHTTVIANLVTAVIQQGALAAQMEAATDAIHNNRDILHMMKVRQAVGEIGAADVAAQETALANAEAALPPLTRQLEHQRAVIAMLIGIAPGSPLPKLPALADLTLPDTLPVALPAQIVANRPDVRAAEAQMRGAGADVGAAIAARLPSIQLSANIGGEATRFADMFATGNPFWALIGGVTQPIFHGGALLHQQKAAEAALEAAKAQYRAAVLQAFADVSDALTGLRTDAQALDAAARASDAADRNLGFTRRQLELGSVGTLALLNASASDAQANAQLVQAKAARLTDTVALFQAVGGGVAPQR